MSAHMNRREFLRLSVIAAVGAIAASCRPSPTPTPPPPTAKPAATTAPATAATTAPATAAPVSRYSEAPMLAELVKQGKLPPVDQRLPRNPKLVDNILPEFLVPEIGRYGGTFRILSSSKQYDQMCHLACYQSLTISPSHAGNPITSNLAEYKVSSDFKTFTFELRPGLKWSDGKPVTTKDVQFVFEDVYGNPELSPRGMPTWLRSGNRPGGTPARLEILDDFTFTLTFDAPYGSFPVALGVMGWRNYNEILLPRHYMEQFHKKYADPAKLEALIKENKFETWVQLFQFKNASGMGTHMRVESLPMPKLMPWIAKESSDERVVLERNPYYWKVDAAGNQLPYIDRIEVLTVLDPQVMSLKHMAGEADAAALTIGGVLEQIPLYKENEQKGRYKLRFGRNHNVECDAFLNLTYKDENWRKVVRDVRFRKALSLATDRQELLQAVWYGYGELPTAQDPTYDPAAANKLLDEMGLDKRDAEGFRLGPDGKTFTILLEVENGEVISQHPKAAPLYAEFWNRVGIKTTYKIIPISLWSQRLNANEIQAGVYFDTSVLWFYLNHLQNAWAPLWWLWWTTTGKEGEEPPADVKAYYEKLATVLTLSPDEAYKLHEEAYKTIGKNYWLIMPARNLPMFYFFNVGLGNWEISEKSIANSVFRTLEWIYFKA